jgi:hypothetical protein
MTNPDPDRRTLCEKVNDLLVNSEVEDEKQEQLLRAMLGVARSITDGLNGNSTSSFQADFNNAFVPLTKTKVDMLLACEDSPLKVIVQNPDPITAENGQSSEPEAPHTDPPEIVEDPEQ